MAKLSPRELYRFHWLQSVICALISKEDRLHVVNLGMRLSRSMYGKPLFSNSVFPISRTRVNPSNTSFGIASRWAMFVMHEFSGLWMCNHASFHFKQGLFWENFWKNFI